MLTDIYQKPYKATIEEKEYFFEFDHAALASFETRTNTSIYETFDKIIENRSLMMNEANSMIICGLLKHHSTEEIKEFEKNLIEKPNIWLEIRNIVQFAFLSPLLPPEAVKKIEKNTKKKESMIQKAASKKKN